MSAPTTPRTGRADPDGDRSGDSGGYRAFVAVTRAGAVVARAARRAPVTAALVVALWSVGALTGSLVNGPSPALRSGIGTGIGPLAAGRWWTPLTSALWCADLPSYLLTTVAVVALLPVVERRLRALRVVALLVVAQIAGVLVGLGLVELVGTSDGRWSTQLQHTVALGPGVGVVGAALAVTATMGAMWRRRLRLVLLIGLTMLALYSGLLSDVLRLAGGLSGLALGALWTRNRPALAGRPSRQEGRVLVALVVAASALGPLVAALAQTRVGPLAVLRFVFTSPAPDQATVAQVCADPAAAHDCTELLTRASLSGAGSGLMSIMPVLLLLITAEGLRRGRRAGWIAALLLNLALAVLGLTLAAHNASTAIGQRILLGPGTHTHAWLILTVPALQPLLVAALLVVTRGRFDQRSPVGTYRSVTRTIVVAFVVVGVVHVLGSLLLRDRFAPVPGIGAVVADLPIRFLPPGYLGELDPAFLPVSWPATWLFEWTGPVFWSVVATATLHAFVRSRTRDAAPDLPRVRALLERTGGDSLSYMSTWAGHSYWFTPDGDAALAYRVIAGVALTTGGPIGDPAARERAVHGFADHCTDHAWMPCLYSVGTDIEQITHAMGWNSVQVAEETVLPLHDLEFTGKKWQDIRTAMNRARKAGVTAEWTSYPTAPLVITDQIRAIAEEWAADKRLPEMGFTLGGLDELQSPDVRLLIAVDQERTVHGVTSWLPVRRDGVVVGWTLDFMRRRTDGFNGVMEFLIASAATSCAADGAEFLSLSGAPLARLDDGEPVSGLQRLLDLTSDRLEPVYGFASLLAFKAKFQPLYRPQLLAYPDPVALPAIANAILRAYLPHLSARQTTRLARAVMT